MTQVINLEELMERIDNDLDFLQEITALFREDGPKLMAQLRQGLENLNAQEVAAAAHTLKGAVGNFAAPSCFEAARQLEWMGRTHDLTEAGPAFAHLAREMARLEQALLDILQKGR